MSLDNLPFLLFKNLPDDIINIIKEFIIFKPKNKEELSIAIKNYNKELYSDISLWDTSLITDISYLFHNMYFFNEDISN